MYERAAATACRDSISIAPPRTLTCGRRPRSDAAGSCRCTIATGPPVRGVAVAEHQRGRRRRRQHVRLEAVLPVVVVQDLVVGRRGDRHDRAHRVLEPEAGRDPGRNDALVDVPDLLLVADDVVFLEAGRNRLGGGARHRGEHERGDGQCAEAARQAADGGCGAGCHGPWSLMRAPRVTCQQAPAAGRSKDSRPGGRRPEVPLSTREIRYAGFPGQRL